MTFNITEIIHNEPNREFPVMLLIDTIILSLYTKNRPLDTKQIWFSLTWEFVYMWFWYMCVCVCVFVYYRRSSKNQGQIKRDTWHNKVILQVPYLLWSYFSSLIWVTWNNKDIKVFPSSSLHPFSPIITINAFVFGSLVCMCVFEIHMCRIVHSVVLNVMCL